MKKLTMAAIGLSILMGSAFAATAPPATGRKTPTTHNKAKKKNVKKATPALRAGKAPGAVK